MANLRKSRFIFGLKMAELIFLLFVSSTLAIVITFFLEDGLWSWLGLMFAFFCLGHLCATVGRFVALPELMCLIATVNWVVAPWLSYRFPSSIFLSNMHVPKETYLPFAVSATICLWLGVHLPLRFKNEPGVEMFTGRLSIRDQRSMDFLIVFGTLISLAWTGSLGGLDFLYSVLSKLRFVGALSFMYTQTPGWKLRIAFVYGFLFCQVASGGLFYEFVLWAGYLFITRAYMKKWKWKFFVYLSLIFILITTLNSAKVEYRYYLENEQEATVFSKLSTLVQLIISPELREKDISLYQDATERIGDKIVRWNQGWIISRVMDTVPEVQPFARGETIVSTVIASMVPRILMPQKLGSMHVRDIFQKYTDIALPEGTSMGLGVAGEMYANFGVWGGVAGTFCYGVLIGYLFSRFARLARKDILWWVWTPFVLLTSIEAEWNLVDVANHITKSALVMFICIHLMPAFRGRMIKKKPLSSTPVAAIKS